ncbi:MAG: OmpA family protein [Flavobacteriaceae bacterium]|nr:OmpA family protein [Flavobacteriaceae bacterium]
MKIKLIYMLLLLPICFIGLSQKRLLNKATKQYETFAYVNTIETYERIIEKGYKDVPMLQKLADAYYFKADYTNAAKWYQELFNLDSNQPSEYLYRYGHSLKSINQEENSAKYLQEYAEKNEEELRAKLLNNQPKAVKVKDRFSLATTNFNSEFSDFGAMFYGEDQIIFSTAERYSPLVQRKHNWDDQYFTKLYVASLENDSITSSSSEKDLFSNELDTKFHETTPTFTKDGKTIYFTRNNYENGKKGKDSKGITSIKIYKADLDEDSKWSNIEALPFTSDSYSTAHPALSPDNKFLYFASDMPGTKGQSDIWRVEITDDGNFGEPENLGETINTESRETFPFISEENELYFASDGHPGNGGLDIFMVNLQKDGSLDQTVNNLGPSINSEMDDFALIIDNNPEKRTGFISSNRSGGMGADDIYTFIEEERLCQQILIVKVIDLHTQEPIENAQIILLSDSFEELDNANTNQEGTYSFEEVDCATKYAVRVSKEEYNTNEVSVITDDKKGSTEVVIELEKTEIPVTVGDDLMKTFNLQDIYFDFDKSNIRYDAAITLSKILDVLNQYPTMELDVRSHTDSRGSHQYNEGLSDRRVKSTIKWFVENGISKDRISGRGYGETQLVNECADGVPCSAEQHQLNRRSEFIITKM